MSERIDQCEGFDVLAARGKGSRWSVHRGNRSLGACPICGAGVGHGTYRAEYDHATKETRFVCVSHPVGVSVPRVVGTDIEGIPAPVPGSWGAYRMDELAARGVA